MFVPRFPGIPDMLYLPDAESGGKYNISGISGNRGKNVLVYFTRSNEITVMLHFICEKLEKSIQNSWGNIQHSLWT